MRAGWWGWEGSIDRGPYALAGLVLLAVKYNLDRLLASAFGQKWEVWNYLAFGGTLLTVPRSDARFYAAMVALALPFIWAGTALTVRRVRSMGMPLWLAALFFLPGVNLLFFLLLTLAPSRVASGAKGSGRARLLDRVIPNHPVGSAALGVLLSGVAGVSTVLVGVQALGGYGWGLFVGLPFTMGLLSVLVYGYHERRSLIQCLEVSLITIGVGGAALIAAALEGVFCLIMALPLAIPLAVLGAWIGYLIQCHPQPRVTAPQVFLLLLAAPVLSGAEAVVLPGPPLLAVETAVDVDAPPEAVWQQVVSFAELPEPDFWLFRIGIAYPRRAEIYGEGAGAVRHCVFSTGPFVEPIHVWDAPWRLRFGVIAQPPPMRELSPYSQVHAPHLDHFLVSREGQFLLTPLAGGRTRLIGTTWYENRMWPADYWRRWSDWIIHRIHQRVLDHIKDRVEHGHV